MLPLLQCLKLPLHVGYGSVFTAHLSGSMLQRLGQLAGRRLAGFAPTTVSIWPAYSLVQRAEEAREHACMHQTDVCTRIE